MPTVASSRLLEHYSDSYRPMKWFSSLPTHRCLLGLALALPVMSALAAATQEFVPAVDVSTYPTLQAAIDANPGTIIRVPAGEYRLTSALVIRHNRTQIVGPARIVQSNPKEAMLTITDASGVRVSDLAFTRSEGQQETTSHGVQVVKSRDVILSHLDVSENHTRSSIVASDSQDITVQNCTVKNFKGPTIDDRTAPQHLSGYAFKSIDGTGIQMRNVQGAVIRDNRVQEFRLLPTKETRDKYDLGTLTIVPAKPGRLMSEQIFRARYTNNWHQGAGIHVAGPDQTRRVIISGNFVEHAPQGIDIHSDNVVVTNNIIAHAMIGMKAMHGSKNVLIDGNQFTYVDLWGIVLMTGAASRAAGNPMPSGGVTTENVDGGHIISNNIISNFGFGLQDWNWVETKANRCAIQLPKGQLEENPPLRNVVIAGNVVYDSGQDQIMVDGKWTKVPPRYNYALYVEQTGKPSPQNVRVHGNVFDPGLNGTTNLPDPSQSN